MFFIIDHVGQGEKVIDITTAVFERSFLDFREGLRLDIHQDAFRVDRPRLMECSLGIVYFESTSLPVYKNRIISPTDGSRGCKLTILHFLKVRM